MTIAAKSDLPRGWSWSTLNDVCTKIQDGTHFSPKTQLPSGTYRYVTAKNVRPSGLDLSDLTYLTEGDHRAIYARCDTKKGDVLLVKDGVNTGDAAINTIDEEISLLSSVCMLRPVTDTLLASYLRYYLLSPVGYGLLTGQMTGTAIKRIILRRIKETPIPIAPLHEQQRIVAAIEEQFTRLDAAVAGLKRTQANLKRYRAAVLTAACSGRLVPTEAELARQEGRDYEPADQLLKRILTERRERWESGQLAKMQAQGKVPGQRSATGKYREPTGPEAPVPTSMPEGWEWATIDQLLVSDLSNGRSVPDMAGGFPVLRLTALKNGRIDLSQRKAGAWTRDDAAPFLVKHGDFLVSRGNGSLSLVGRGGIVDIEPDGVAYPDTLIRVRTSERGIDPKYLESVWNSRIVRRQIEAVARTTAGIYKINQRDLKQIVIPVPPVVEQQRIVGEIERHWSVLDSLEDSTANALIRAGRLRQSILSRAFEGRLVPQDPTDEPAEALLERIRAERAANLSKGRQRRHGAHKTAQQPLFDLQEVGETE